MEERNSFLTSAVILWAVTAVSVHAATDVQKLSMKPMSN